jgi:hypothetical protein
VVAPRTAGSSCLFIGTVRALPAVAAQLSVAVAATVDDRQVREALVAAVSEGFRHGGASNQ